MEVKCLEIRDKNTFLPVICIRPTPDNDVQRYLLRRDGYSGGPDEQCIIMIDAQCRGVAYDPYNWRGSRTHTVAHKYISDRWAELADGDVVDVEFILVQTPAPKKSERLGDA
jgi:hypothetical protein